MARRSPLVLAAVVAALWLAPPGARAAGEAHVETHTATSPAGEVRAELRYTKRDLFMYEDVRVKITRAGQVLLDAPVPPPCDECPINPSGGGDFDSMQLLDLDKDGEPEAMVDLYTGGAHCCLFSVIYGYRAATNVYDHTIQGWQDAGYTLKDLDGDGSPEFRSADARFAYAFTAYVFSGFPIQVFRYRDLDMTDVTRRFKRLVKRDARSHLKIYRRARKDEDADVRGFLAAYVADKYRLGQGKSAWSLVYAAYRRGELHGPTGDESASGKGYIKALRKFLRQLGYS
ncbi:MAG TPA: hypothetical protein VF520_13960 [Thermoleophilaceae bacterium]|jgi:hypothetical protein